MRQGMSALQPNRAYARIRREQAGQTLRAGSRISTIPCHLRTLLFSLFYADIPKKSQSPLGSFPINGLLFNILSTLMIIKSH